jgi:electron transfer flavoprotein beta subunit
MKAKKKPIDVLSPEELGVDVSPRTTTLEVVDPPARKAGVKVASVAELLDKLRNEAKVIS